MKKIMLILLLTVCFFNVHSQTECGTKAPPEAEYERSLAKMRMNPQSRSLPTKFIRVFIVNFLNNAGTDSSWTRQEINSEFQLAKDLLKPYDICLVLEGVDNISNSSLQNVDVSSETTIQAASYHSNCLNIYLHKTLTLGTLGLNGYAYAINSQKLSLSRGAITQRSMAHEVGHCFGLLHTFETAYGIECPDGSNSSTAGDKLTDTRATPDADVYMASNTNSSCAYTGNATIVCNGSTQAQTYDPEITNIMCYGRRTCRQNFSNDQYSLMHSILSQPSWFTSNLYLFSSNFIFNQSVNYDAVFLSSYYIEIGDGSPSINTILGFDSKQRFLSEGQIKIRTGTKISATSTRTKVVIKATSVCDEIINYSF